VAHPQAAVSEAGQQAAAFMAEADFMVAEAVTVAGTGKLEP
jgi:hypothetical protein